MYPSENILKSSNRPTFSAGFDQSESGPKAVGTIVEVESIRICYSKNLGAVAEKISEKV